jgi:hypothetical protein
VLLVRVPLVDLVLLAATVVDRRDGRCCARSCSPPLGLVDDADHCRADLLALGLSVGLAIWLLTGPLFATTGPAGVRAR